jgi:hypothetical protein
MLRWITAACGFVWLVALVVVPASAVPLYGVALISTSTEVQRHHVHLTFGDAQPPAASAAPFAAQAVAAPAFRRDTPLHSRAGERRPFWTRWYDATDRQRRDDYTMHAATLALSTAHADIWVDDDVPAALLDTIRAALARDVENAYAVDTRFGSLSYTAAEVADHERVPACDALGRRNGSVAAAVPSRGELFNVLIVPAARVRYGYMDRASYGYQAAANCFHARSNELPALLVWAVEDRHPAELRDATLVDFPAHELQHAQSFVQHEVRSAVAHYQPPLVNEGLSMLAQDFAVDRLFARRFDTFSAGYSANVFLSAPNEVSILGFTFAEGPRAIHGYGSGAYGGAYMLQRYLYDQLGDAYVASLATTEQVGVPAMEAAAGLPIAEIMRRFATRLLAPYANGYALPICTTAFDQLMHPVQFRGARLQPLESSDVDVLDGSVSLYLSSRPIAAIDARRAPVSFVQVSYGDVETAPAFPYTCYYDRPLPFVWPTAPPRMAPS